MKIPPSLVRSFLSSLLFLAGCASTQIQSSWRDPAYNFAGTKSILVLGVVKEEGPKRVMEDAFVKELAARQIQGIPSYSILPAQGQIDKEGLERLVKEKGIQGLLVVRFKDKKTVERDVPPTTTVVNSGPSHAYSANNLGAFNGMDPYANNMYGYYNNSYQVISQPGYTVTDNFAVVETKLFDTNSSKMVWTGLSDTLLNSGTQEALIKQFARVVANAIYQ